MTLPLYRKRTPRRRPEAQLQKAVVQHLMLTANPGVRHFAIRNEGKRSVVEGYQAKLMGMIPGIADLGIVVGGRIHFLELKSEKGKPSEAQIAFRDDCLAAGIPYRMASTINDALLILTEWGAIKPSSSRRAA